MRFTLGHVNDAVHVEGHLLGRRRPVLVAEAVRVSSVGLRLEGMIAVGDGASMLDVVAYGVLYPEINLQAPTASKLSIADLVGHGHLVALLQRFVETFSRVCAQLDVVAPRQLGEQAQAQEHQG